MRTSLRALAALAVLMLSACANDGVRGDVAHVRPAAATVPAADWDAWVGEFITETFNARPHQGVSSGRHEYDGRMADWSLDGLAADIARLHAARDRAKSFAEASLDARQRFEREYVLDAIERDLFWEETMRWRTRSPGGFGWALDPGVYLTRDYAPLDVRMRAYIAYANAIPRVAEQIRASMRTPMPRTYVQLGHILFGGLAGFYERQVPPIFASVQDAALQAQFRDANARATQAMKGLDAWMTSLEPTATGDFAIGATRFAEMLWATERVDVPIARLKEIGERDMQRNLAALRDACAKYLPGASLRECTDKVKADKPKEGPVAAAERQLTELRAFIVSHKVVTIPSDERAQVAESPPYQRWNAAYIDTPGPYEKPLASIYYIAPPDPNWTPQEQAAYIPGKSDLLFISVHEVWPGHFLQFLHARRAPSKLGRVFSSYAFGEGWAHYAEEMMWEAGLNAGDPETHIGQLMNALLRDARYLSAIGLHTGGMTVEQSEALFRDKAFQDPGNARQQAARGTFDPGYGNYLLGKLMIRKLRDDWTATRGGRAAWQAFHDELLSHGAPTLPLLRTMMLGPDSGPPL